MMNKMDTDPSLKWNSYYSEKTDKYLGRVV